MTTQEPGEALREMHIQWLEQIAEHVEEAGESSPYHAAQVLNVLYLRCVPTPHQLFPALANTDFFAPEYLRAAAQWIREHKPLVIPPSEHPGA